MATRLIVTSHPDVACDVCGRRLLRGEQPDIFLGGGQRRTVCELCAPRAAHEGWLRETEQRTPSARPERARRTRSLLGRLRQLREPDAEGALPASELSPIAPRDRDDTLYDFLDSPLSAPKPELGEDLFGLDERATVARREVTERQRTDAGESAAQPVPAARRSAPTPPTAPAAPVEGATGRRIDRREQRAVELFNAGEQPRRLAGIARSLGAPVVRVAPRAGSEDVVALLLAWELCWYRYEIDLSEEAAAARLAAEGMELDELASEERIANAVADEHGELSLL
jgi:hypothetical protein